MLGVCDRNTFEGEAAMALESLVREGIEGDYPVVMRRDSGYTEVDFSSMVLGIIKDQAAGVDRSDIATRFHNTIASVIAEMAATVTQERDVRDIALSGGTFQNLYLLKKTTALLTGQGMRVYRNRQMPPNDACISLGQAYLVRERLKKCGG
jgi:hydrogenase maturation protein HypF